MLAAVFGAGFAFEMYGGIPATRRAMAANAVS